MTNWAVDRCCVRLQVLTFERLPAPTPLHSEGVLPPLPAVPKGHPFPALPALSRLEVCRVCTPLSPKRRLCVESGACCPATPCSLVLQADLRWIATHPPVPLGLCEPAWCCVWSQLHVQGCSRLLLGGCTRFDCWAPIICRGTGRGAMARTGWRSSTCGWRRGASPESSTAPAPPRPASSA